MSKRTRPTAGDCPWYRKGDLMRLFTVSDRTVEKWVSSGRLPQPVRRGRTWVRWPKDVIDQLIAAWMSGKEGGAP